MEKPDSAADIQQSGLSEMDMTSPVLYALKPQNGDMEGRDIGVGREVANEVKETGVRSSVDEPRKAYDINVTG